MVRKSGTSSDPAFRAADEAAVRAFERPANGGPYDETDINLRGYIARIPGDKLAEYDPEWSDEQVMAWDENFRDDGELMLVCCERDVDVQHFRRELEEWIRVLVQNHE